MKIHKIQINNYGPFYGPHEFEFSNRGLVLVMGNNLDEPRMDSNGSGKSSIFDALDWCLFGKVPREDHVDSIRNEEAKICTVHTHVEDDAGRLGIITRIRKTRTTELFFGIDGASVTALDTKETQRLIEDFLGLDRDVFHAAVLFGQMDLTHYADSTDAERMTILTKILQLDEIDVLLERAKEASSGLHEQKQRKESEAQSLESVLTSLSATDFGFKIDEWEIQRANEISRLEGLVTQSQAQVSTLEASFQPAQDLERELAQLNAQMSTIPVPSGKEADDHRVHAAGIRARMEMIRSSIGTYRNEVNRLTTELQAPEQRCSSCGQVVPRTHHESALAQVQGNLAAEEAKYQQMDSEARAAHAKYEELQAVYETARVQAEEFRSGFVARTTEIQTLLSTNRTTAMQLEQARKSVASATQMLDSKRMEVNPYVEQKRANEQAVAAKGEELRQVQEELKGISGEFEYLDFWLKAFGPKGLKSYILDSRLQALTDAVNEWVHILTGGTIWIRFESQKKTRGKKVVNSPDIRVFRWNPDGTITERNFCSWSGGEKQRISFAIDFGLSRLIANRSKKKYDVLILDEVFRHLDRSGKEAVVEMLQGLSREKSSVLVVEHDPDFQDAFDYRILVQKQNRRSTILEVDNGKEGDDILVGDAQHKSTRRKTVRREPVIG
jgi:DNA repair exonuclease SbcCD ATPase subunit